MTIDNIVKPGDLVRANKLMSVINVARRTGASPEYKDSAAMHSPVLRGQLFCVVSVSETMSLYVTGPITVLTLVNLKTGQLYEKNIPSKTLLGFEFNFENMFEVLRP